MISNQDKLSNKINCLLIHENVSLLWCFTLLCFAVLSIVCSTAHFEVCDSARWIVIVVNQHFWPAFWKSVLTSVQFDLNQFKISWQFIIAFISFSYTHKHTLTNHTQFPALSAAPLCDCMQIKVVEIRFLCTCVCVTNLTVWLKICLLRLYVMLPFSLEIACQLYVYVRHRHRLLISREW